MTMRINGVKPRSRYYHAPFRDRIGFWWPLRKAWLRWQCIRIARRGGSILVFSKSAKEPSAIELFVRELPMDVRREVTRALDHDEGLVLREQWAIITGGKPQIIIDFTN